ncbi:TorF family putative porin [Niveibacterium sp. SC-1]|uniref:TorF family putative porin n=1 Tax=Niveibacterium sp. SC-1 TaxID=3135646 RepID=UPI00311FAF8E
MAGPLVGLLVGLFPGVRGALAQTPEEDVAGSPWQWATSIAVDSDYRFRGVSLSNDSPSLHLALSVDHISGWYGGAALSSTKLDADGQGPQWLAYLGHTQPLSDGLAWEVGGTASHFGTNAHYDYAELYAGLATPRWSLRAYWSPDYFGRDWSSLYAECNANLPLRDTLRAFAHAGVLMALTAGETGKPPARADFSLGLSLTVEALQWQLAWVGSSRAGPYYDTRRNTAVLSVSAYF